MEGIVEIVGANAVWIDPVAVLSSSYSNFKISHSRYYSRSSFDNRNSSTAASGNDKVDKGSRKRKRKKKYTPNAKELLAERRHQEARGAILNAHSSFLESTQAEISAMATIDICSNSQCSESTDRLLSATNGTEERYLDFRQLAEVWQAPLYELNILKTSSKIIAGGGCCDDGNGEQVSNTYQLFNDIIENDSKEAIAECAGASFLLPNHCRFLISDVTQAHQLIPGKNGSQGNSNAGYNIILIDPPWENKSVHRKSLYPTMPNKQLFSLPVKQLVHREGALVALWLTNREKLHQFVENELFPAWQVKLAATWYWLKLNASGDMISPLDLQHHKPYEILLLGYHFGERQVMSSIEIAQEENVRKTAAETGQKFPPQKFVVLSVPGDHSRKPPIGSQRASKGLELFARELNSGWTSWGNEPLHFQNLAYFQHKP